MNLKSIGAAFAVTAAVVMSVLPAQAQDREWPGRAFVTKESCSVAGPVPGGTYEGEGFLTVGITPAPQGTVNAFVSCHTDQVAGPELQSAFQANNFPCFVFGILTFDSKVVISASGKATVICKVKKFDLPG